MLRSLPASHAQWSHLVVLRCALTTLCDMVANKPTMLKLGVAVDLLALTL
ncbi:hypothetical protein SLEP1_g17934 [Rubroshorea leprosula]|uniref:Uncharacterized protein n=1 Tax=Rubroshorea leprosula TaxID=152421 RepID=A0AAV5J1D7_9ROSI|nr:hypothetical protein SLEP1_g17934 [Rubroshorea leprosula]